MTVEVRATGPAELPGVVARLVEDRMASRLAAKDHTLWGAAAEEESAKRLGWVDLHDTSRALLPQLDELVTAARADGLDRVVLCGMGGSSLAPEVICATAGRDLVVLDSSHPDVVRHAVGDRLERTVVVVSSKSGSTVETDSQRRAYEQAFRDAGIDPAERIVVVTDPGSPLDRDSREKGYRVVNADPNVGGRYSALTAFGLVPSGLAGVDVAALLDEAESVADVLAADDEANPALRLGAAMGGTQPLRNKLVLVDDGTEVVGFADRAEQLIAESTGKDGTGVLPVVVAGRDDPEVVTQPADVLLARLVPQDDETKAAGDEVRVSGSLGAQLLLWEAATAVAGRLLGINPFDQPDVESAKKAARGLLESGTREAEPAAYVDGAVEVRSLGGDWLGDATTVADAVDALLTQLSDSGYVAVMAYLDRLGDADLATVRADLARRTNRPVTFGWGPRFLHSTGQFHKGGPAEGVYLQVTSAPAEDLAVPGRDFTFGEFIAAQAGGDAQVLAEHARPVLRLHLTDHDAGLAQVMAALTGGGRG